VPSVDRITPVQVQSAGKVAEVLPQNQWNSKSDWAGAQPSRADGHRKWLRTQGL